MVSLPSDWYVHCSFGEAEEEAEDGEVFKVRKSSYSRRIAKELEKERRRKKYEDSEPARIDESITVKKEDNDPGVTTIDLPISDGMDAIRVKVSGSTFPMSPGPMRTPLRTMPTPHLKDSLTHSFIPVELHQNPQLGGIGTAG